MKQSSIITSLTSKIQTGFRYKRILSFHRGYTIKSKNCTNLSIIIQSRILKSRLIFQYLGKLSINSYRYNFEILSCGRVSFSRGMETKIVRIHLLFSHES